MCNVQDSIMGECYRCGVSIPISECICKHCLEDLEKEGEYEDYLDSFDFE